MELQWFVRHFAYLMDTQVDIALMSLADAIQGKNIIIYYLVHETPTSKSELINENENNYEKATTLSLNHKYHFVLGMT